MNTRRTFMVWLAGLLGGWFGAKSAVPKPKECRQGIIKIPLSGWNQDDLKQIAEIERKFLERYKESLATGCPGLLPPDCRVVGVSPHVSFISNEMVVKVEHDSLPATKEGERLPYVRPCFMEHGKFAEWEIIQA